MAAGADGSERPSLAPQPGLGELDALVERVRGTGLDIAVERSGRPFAVSGAAGLTVYRIVQEALTNALKHADELAAVQVRLAFSDPDVSVRVTDDGRPACGPPSPPPTAPARHRHRQPGVSGRGRPRRPRRGRDGRTGCRVRWHVRGRARDRRVAGRSWPRCATARRRPPHDGPDRAGRRPGAAAQGVPHDPRGRGRPRDRR